VLRVLGELAWGLSLDGVNLAIALPKFSSLLESLLLLLLLSAFSFFSMVLILFLDCLGFGVFIYSPSPSPCCSLPSLFSSFFSLFPFRSFLSSLLPSFSSNCGTCLKQLAIIPFPLWAVLSRPGSVCLLFRLGCRRDGAGAVSFSRCCA